MSGFVGIVQADGAPVDRGLLERLTASMAYCGPDGTDVFAQGPVGLGHALLSAAPNPPDAERQPASLDGRSWIAADARVDGRAGLAAELRAEGLAASPEAPDAHLVLLAYAAWGDRCVEHLVGDFAFAIWDVDRKRLVCARDHFGVVPLYFVRLAGGLLFGNVLWSLRRHPAVSDALDDRVVGDFLLFGFNGDPSATTFADIRAVPPAHVLTWQEGVVETRRYWEPPAGGERLRLRPDEHVERFRDLFDRAVGDRLRTGRAGTHLSGGMDSTSVAATARHVLDERGGEVDLRGYTVVWTRVIDEEEGRYAQLVARRLGVPLEQLVAEDFVYRLEPESEWVFPEPSFVPGQSAEYEIGRRVARFSRTLLAGLGGDPLFHFELGLPRGVGQWLGLARSIRLGLADGHVPPLGVRRALRRKLLREPQPVPELPAWIAPGFAHRADLEGRLAEAASLPRPSDRDMLTNAKWPAIFAWAHPGAHGRPYRSVFPFFDLRLAEEVWRTPPYPWRLEKRLLREAMRDRLPEAVLRRPKTVLYRLSSRPGGDNPRYRIAIEPEMRRWRAKLLSNPLVSDYVDVQVARSLVESPVPHGAQHFDQCVALAYWLGSAFDVPRNPPGGKETRDAANRTAA